MNYWQARFATMEADQHKKDKEYIKDLERQFQIAQNNMQADMEKWYYRLAENNDITYTAAKKLLKADELEEFHWTVEQYIEKGKQNAVDKKWMKQLENASAKTHINRLQALLLQMQQEAELLYQQYNDGVTSHLNKSYADRFYHTAYEIAKGSRVGHNLAKLDDRKIEVILKKPWAQDGTAFSDRIWKNKEKLVNTLHTELTQHVIRGTDPYKAVQAVSKRMDVNLKQAATLVYTESAALTATAQAECFKELDVEEFEIVATLDSHTSDICREMDGKHFPMKEYAVGMTAPPFHCNCRSVTCPYFDDEFTEGSKRAAREEDGEAYYVPADMTYKEWKEAFVDGGKHQMTFMQKKDRIYDNEEKIASLYEQKKGEELKMLTSSSVEDMESAQKQAAAISDEIKKLRKENEDLQNSLGLPTNAKERFHNQKIDISKLPQDVKGDNELGAISSWTRTDYLQINDYLRNGNKGVRPESIQNAEILKKMIDRNIVKEPFTVKRGTDFNAMNHLFGSDSWQELGYNVDGKIITDDGFFATTPDLHGGFSGGIQMYIDIPKGAKGIYIGDLSAASNEKEFLLQCGTSFYVEKIEIWYNEWNEPCYDIYMRVKVGE